ncbi:hypothetical protein KI387_031921, partial [Taxus chinensis]
MQRSIPLGSTMGSLATTCPPPRKLFQQCKLHYEDTGWPNAGDLNQLGANIFNAAHYNRRLVRRMLADPPLGTLRRPNQYIPVFIFSVFNENQKVGTGAERHWGLLYPNGSRSSRIHSIGPFLLHLHLIRVNCGVADLKANISALLGIIGYACGQGNNTCLAIQSGMPCYQPNFTVRHASYAFNSNWQQFKNTGACCYFNGAVTMVTKDP